MCHSSANSVETVGAAGANVEKFTPVFLTHDEAMARVSTGAAGNAEEVTTSGIGVKSNVSRRGVAGRSSFVLLTEDSVLTAASKDFLFEKLSEQRLT